MSTRTIALESPLPFRLLAWLNERYPPDFSLFFLVLYVAAWSLGHILTKEGPLLLHGQDLVGFVAVWCFFLLLRIFDEHKDYQDDLTNYPDRVLSRGLVTLGQLKVLGVLSVLIQIAICLWWDRGLGAVSLAWLLMFGWSALMAKEFFCRVWLTQHLLLYAVSHLLVMPLVILWMAQMGADQASLGWEMGWPAAMCFFYNAGFEVIRKTFAPEDEKAGVDSYSKRLGLGRATQLVSLLVLLGVGVQVVVMNRLLGIVAWFWFAALAAIVLLALIQLRRFALTPSHKTHKLTQLAVSMAMFFGWLIVLVAAVVGRGLIWQA